MRYVVKQKFWSFMDNFAIKNDAGDDVATVAAKVFSFGVTLTFRDVAGNDLALIKHVLLSSELKYEIYRDSALAAVVTGGRKPLTLFGIRFDVGASTFRFVMDVPGPNDLVAEGKLNEHEYRFLRGDQAVATVSKKWFAWDDTYGVEVEPSEDAVLILAATIVIDMVLSRD